MPASMSAFLNVTDIRRSIEFYQGLGFRLDKAYTDKESGTITYADLSYQGAELGLGNISWNDDPDFQKWVGTPLGAGVILYVNVPDVDKVHERARKVGAVIEFPPTDRPYGRLFMLNDPDGYSISFIREPSAGRTRKAAGKASRKGAKAGARASSRKGARKGARAGAGKGAKKATGKTAKKTAKKMAKKTAKKGGTRPAAKKAKSPRRRR